MSGGLAPGLLLGLTLLLRGLAVDGLLGASAAAGRVVVGGSGVGGALGALARLLERLLRPVLGSPCPSAATRPICGLRWTIGYRTAALASPEHKRSPLVVAATALVLLASGCGSEEADLENGKRLFTGEGQCGKCHTLERAGTGGTIGPSLDAAFGQARADGLGETTLEGVIYDQILNPVDSSVMPADLVTGQDARDVAAYVAQAARRPGQDEGGAGELAGSDPTAREGRALFLSKGCGGCHILSDAKTGASEGPTLNSLHSAARIKGGSARKYIEEAILDPDKDIVGGFRPGVMPSDYRDRLTGDELDKLVDYLLRVTR